MILHWIIIRQADRNIHGKSKVYKALIVLNIWTWVFRLNYIDKDESKVCPGPSHKPSCNVTVRDGPAARIMSSTLYTALGLSGLYGTAWFTNENSEFIVHFASVVNSLGYFWG